ncbi:Peroxisomal membrane protein PMP27 [Linderina macrospora]|uniref:Peroxisomal membrane protein PMP27 n=1 Tax=Linderina macrospora TaxID=4868 RepID=A0ACC1JH39_9FUNG|nr:Peroxisomal membrane protein PMP27 [Linderina macrospora]
MSGAISILSLVANNHAANIYIKYASTLVGRDKACRFAQYFSRFLVYLLSQRTTKPTGTSWLTALTKVQGAMGTTRKIMRSGKFIDFLNLFVKSLATKGEDEVTKFLNSVHKLGMFVFMAFDTLGLLGSLSVVTLRDAGKVGRTAQRGWMVAIVCQLLAAVYQLRSLRMREVDLERVRRHVEKSADVMGDREIAVEQQIIKSQAQAARRQLVVAALDLTIPVKGLGLLPINEGLVALAGTVTSLLGAQDVLAKITV